MEKINYEKYFGNIVRISYDSKLIITILEDIMKNDLVSLRTYIEKSGVSVDSEQIKEYLDKVFEEENPEVKKRIENPKSRKRGIVIVGELTEQDIKDSVQEFGDNLEARRYQFQPYTLKYFKKYISILKKKILTLLSLIEKIGNKECQDIKELLIDLDIRLDENGNISKEDIIRLITPTIYNINKFQETIEDANNLSTYLTFKMSKISLGRDGISECEIYPSSSIQIKSLLFGDAPGEVPLSQNQKEELREHQLEGMRKSAKRLLS